MNNTFVNTLSRNAFLVLIVSTFLFAGYWYAQRNETGVTRPRVTKTNDVQGNPCTPTFLDGGGPYYIADVPFRERIAPEENNGEELIVSGKIFQDDCETPLASVVLDVWQANESGNYEDEWYRGHVKTDEEGNYSFTTVIPKGYGVGTGYRPPHIHFKVWDDEKLLVTSQMFFPDAKGKQGFDEAYIIGIEEIKDDEEVIYHGYHDIYVP